MQDAVEVLATQRASAQQAQAVLQQQITAEERQRQQVVTALEGSVYTAYQRLAGARGGQVVVSVQSGTCGGCYLKVQPQLVSEIRRQDKLVMCPHCQRMLLWPVE